MKLFSNVARALTALSLLGRNVIAIDLDPTQPDQLKDVAKKVATDLMSQYANPNDGNKVISGIPGLLTYPPYYWWEAGAMFGQLIDYWYYTNDSQYNDLVKEGMLHQINAPLGDLMPDNQTKDEGNDDQLFWAFTVMSAAELNFPNPPGDTPGWLALAQSVMNQLITRWDNQTCNGGLRWQIRPYIGGYNYKNTAANGGMFQLGARLAKYTGNATYANWANTAYDWLAQSPLTTKDYQVFDGTDVLKGCVDADRTQWSYNYGIMIGGAAYMYNYTNGSQIWMDRLQGFLKHTDVFFPQDKGGVMVEVCDPYDDPPKACNVDQLSFKAYLARWMAVAAQLVPSTHDQIMPKLQVSAKAAAKSCNVGDSKCSQRWWMDSPSGGNLGPYGVGQQMSALSVIASNLIGTVPGPYSANTGGTSQGNPNAGMTNQASPPPESQVTKADKIGAGILTTLVLIATLGGAWFMVS